MNKWALVLSICVISCAHKPQQVVTPAELVSKMKMEGEGKARLEIGSESWVFSFESVYSEADKWIMALRIPLQGEELFMFTNLDQTHAQPADKDDFRWQVVQALQVASQKRRLNYPQIGTDFINRLHQLLKILRPKAKPLACREVVPAQKWECGEGVEQHVWLWDTAKEEVTLEFFLKPHWILSTVFKNLTGTDFKRVTLELTRQTESKSFVELRQEIFFQDQ